MARQPMRRVQGSRLSHSESSAGDGRNFKIAGRLTGPLVAVARVPKIIWSLPSMGWRIAGEHRTGARKRAQPLYATCGAKCEWKQS